MIRIFFTIILLSTSIQTLSANTDGMCISDNSKISSKMSRFTSVLTDLKNRVKRKCMPINEYELLKRRSIGKCLSPEALLGLRRKEIEVLKTDSEFNNNEYAKNIEQSYKRYSEFKNTEDGRRFNINELMQNSKKWKKFEKKFKDIIGEDFSVTKMKDVIVKANQFQKRYNKANKLLKKAMIAFKNTPKDERPGYIRQKQLAEEAAKKARERESNKPKYIYVGPNSPNYQGGPVNSTARINLIDSSIKGLSRINIVPTRPAPKPPLKAVGENRRQVATSSIISNIPTESSPVILQSEDSIRRARIEAKRLLPPPKVPKRTSSLPGYTENLPSTQSQIPMAPTPPQAPPPPPLPATNPEKSSGNLSKVIKQESSPERKLPGKAELDVKSDLMKEIKEAKGSTSKLRRSSTSSNRLTIKNINETDPTKLKLYERNAKFNTDSSLEDDIELIEDIDNESKFIKTVKRIKITAKSYGEDETLELREAVIKQKEKQSDNKKVIEMLDELHSFLSKIDEENTLKLNQKK